MTAPKQPTRRDLFRAFRRGNSSDDSGKQTTPSKPESSTERFTPTRPMPTDPTPHPGIAGDTASADGSPPMPDLCESLIDDATVAQLMHDIQACAEVLEVIPKYGAQRYVGETKVSLEEAARLIKQRAVRAVQVRYRYDDAEWWDTLAVTPDGVRVVRIRHTFDR